jgi:hypothetical protein
MAGAALRASVKVDTSASSTHLEAAVRQQWKSASQQVQMGQPRFQMHAQNLLHIPAALILSHQWGLLACISSNILHMTPEHSGITAAAAAAAVLPRASTGQQIREANGMHRQSLQGSKHRSTQLLLPTACRPSQQHPRPCHAKQRRTFATTGQP